MADEGSFYDKMSQNPEGHVEHQDLKVEGDPFEGVGKEVAEALENESGQEPGSPSGKEDGADTGAKEKGQEGSESPADQKGEEGSEADTSTAKPEEGKEQLPYDQDPKWKAARAAEKALNEMMTKHNIEDIDTLNHMLDSGLTLKDIVGDMDAEALKGRLEQAQKMDRTEEFWAEKESLQKESEESAEQTVERVKRENANLKAEMAEKEANAKAIAANQRIVRDYEDAVSKEVESSDLSPEGKVLARHLMGVDNPVDSIDIADQSKVKTTIGDGITNLSKFIASIEQAAIDNYAAGKSERTPVPKQTTPVNTPHVEKKASDPNASVEDTFDDAKNELKATFERLMAEGE